MISEIKDTFNQVTSPTLHKFTRALEQKTNPLTEKVAYGVVESLQRQASNSLDNWVNAHPILGWFTIHPIVTLISAFVLLLLLVGLFGAIGRLTEQLWISILQSPLKFSLWILNKVPQTLTSSLSKTSNKEQRLSYIMNRLEEIKKEQEELWLEMTKLLKMKP